MCGRTVMPKKKTVEEAFKVSHGGDLSQVMTDVTPGNSIIAITNDGPGEYVAGALKWGVYDMYNARVETVDKKPFWKDAWQAKSFAIVPSIKFKEGWGWYGLSSGKPLALAALYTDQWSEDGEYEIVIMTTQATGSIKTHGRMPVLLEPSIWDRYLDQHNFSIQDLIVSSNNMATQLTRL